MAAQVLPEAYKQGLWWWHASRECTPAHVRRAPHIQKVTGQELRDNYFTQTLLPDYLVETCADWDVVFDARALRRAIRR